MEDGPEVDPPLADAVLELLHGVLAQVHHLDARLQPGQPPGRLHVADLQSRGVHLERGGPLQGSGREHWRRVRPHGHRPGSVGESHMPTALAPRTVFDVVREGGVYDALLVVGVGVHGDEGLDVRLGQVQALRAGQAHGVQAAPELLPGHAAAPQRVEVLAAAARGKSDGPLQPT